MTSPLADLLRPKTLEEVVGQEHLLGEQGVITSSIRSATPLSLVLWGPPGCGKTTVARLYAAAFSMTFRSIHAVFSGVADLKKLVQEIEAAPLLHRRTVLFVDEIHRFNKAQQDAFLPWVEKGLFTLIGATTENPSFYLNDALLSRVRVLQLQSLSEQDLEKILARAEAIKGSLPVTPEAHRLLVTMAQGDGRYILNMVEDLLTLRKEEQLDEERLQSFLQRRAPLYDKRGDGHYNLISALHKSVRGSDPDAALYWLCRMLNGGEDPLYLCRRMVRMATEDIGLADPQALQLAMAVRQTYEFLGSPEGELALAELVIYLALAPKSNSSYVAFGKAKEAAAATNHLAPPLHILNAPTKLMKQLHYGAGYAYDHDAPQAFSGQHYFPQGMDRKSFYAPVERGFEREMKKRLEYFTKLRETLFQT